MTGSGHPEGAGAGLGAVRPLCPCGSRTAYDVCCGRLHRGAARATTPVELMRSRYAAYAVGGDLGGAHLVRTWHPRTRPAAAHLAGDSALVWTGLEVLDAPDPGDAASAEVEFVAHYVREGVPGRLHERSRFVRRAGQWVYLDGATDESTSA